MTDAGFSRRKQQLLDKFLDGQIDKPTYDVLLADLQDLVVTTGRSVAADEPVQVLSSVPSFSVSESKTASERSALASPVPLLEPGIELGGFRLTRQLNRGGMGEVWMADDPTGERKVVVKVLPPELQRSPDEMARVKQTFGRVHNLQHQHICPVYLLGRDARFGYYIVMKYIDGVTLAAHRKSFVQREGSFALSELIRLLSPVAAALDYAHRRQIIHRDIKPQNIMLSADGQDVQLVDFGLAAEVRTSVMQLSQAPMDTCGTYPYMAPEQWRGEMQDARTDQYALAVVAFELVSGQLPFQGTDPAVLRMCVLNDPAPVPAGVSAAIASVIARGLSKSRADRFENCTEFVRALAREISDQSEPNSGRSAVTSSPGATAERGRSATEMKRTFAEPAEAKDSVKTVVPVHSGNSTAPARSLTRSPASLQIPAAIELDELEILEAEETDDAVVEQSVKARPMQRPRVRTVNSGELALKKANARAIFWISVVVGAMCSFFLGGLVWLVWYGLSLVFR